MDHSKLTAEQKAFVMSGEETKARIIAVPGSGKTTTIMHRIAYLVEVYNVNPKEILCISFSNTAVSEMKNRIIRMIGAPGRDINAKTYHSLCFNILNDNRPLIYGNNLPVTILSSDKKDSLLSDIFDDVYNMQEMQMKKQYLNSLKHFIGMRQTFKVKNEADIQHLNSIERDQYDNFEYIYTRYQKYMKDHNAVDFESMQIHALTILLKDAIAKSTIANKYKYIFVDEFQDTSWVQVQTLLNIIKDDTRITICGDVDQNLYSWRGSNNEYMLRFDQLVEGINDYFLSKNFRSSNQIITAANSIITKNQDRFDVEIKTNEDNDLCPVEVKHYETDENEAEDVSEQIKDLILNKQVPPEEIAVLFNINEIGNKVNNALEERGIPVHFFGKFKFLERKEIKQAINFLRFFANNNDDSACLKLISDMPVKIGAVTKDEIIKYANNMRCSIWQACIKIYNGEADSLLARHKQIKRFVKRVNACDKIIKNPSLTIVDACTKAFELSRISEAYKLGSDTERIENLQKLYDIFNNSGSITIEDMLNYILLNTTEEADEEGPEALTDRAVHLMSIYKSKGLEYRYIFILGNEQTVFPLETKLITPSIEDDRRVFYVALTRGKERVQVSHCSRRILGFRFYNKDAYAELNRSVFIEELLSLPQNVITYVNKNSGE